MAETRPRVPTILSRRDVDTSRDRYHNPGVTICGHIMLVVNPATQANTGSITRVDVISPGDVHDQRWRRKQTLRSYTCQHFAATLVAVSQRRWHLATDVMMKLSQVRVRRKVLATVSFPPWSGAGNHTSGHQATGTWIVWLTVEIALLIVSCSSDTDIIT